MAIKLEGGGGKALVARPPVDALFFAASLYYVEFKFLCCMLQMAQSSKYLRHVFDI